MPAYNVKCLGRDGKQINLCVTSASEEEVVDGLRGKGYYPLEVLTSRETMNSIPLCELEEAPPPKWVEIIARGTTLEKRVLAGDDEAWSALVEWCKNPDSFLQELEASFSGALPRPRRGKMEAAHQQIAEPVLRCESPLEFRDQATRAQQAEDELLAMFRQGDTKVLREMKSLPFGAAILLDAERKVRGTLHINNIDGLVIYFLPGEGEMPPAFMLRAENLASSSYGGFFRKRLSIRTHDGKAFHLAAVSIGKSAQLSRLARVLQYEIKSAAGT